MRAQLVRTRARQGFTLVELAVVIVIIGVLAILVAGALLFVRSFRNLLTIDPGMREEGITVAFAGFHKSNIPAGSWADFRNRLMEEARSAPGVEDAATTTNVPLLGSAWGTVAAQAAAMLAAWTSDPPASGSSRSRQART